MASGAAIQSPIGFIMMRLALGATESGLMPVSAYTDQAQLVLTCDR